jgi:hypothetical protein
MNADFPNTSGHRSAALLSTPPIIGLNKVSWTSTALVYWYAPNGHPQSPVQRSEGVCVPNIGFVGDLDRDECANLRECFK